MLRSWLPLASDGKDALVTFGSTHSQFPTNVNSANVILGNVVRAAAGASNITQLRIIFGGNTGTVTNAAQVDVFAVSASLQPTGSSLGTLTFTPTANSVNTINISDAAVTPGNLYHIQIKNVDATPASNFFTVQSVNYVNNQGMRQYFSLRSTDGGTTWLFENLNSYAIFAEYDGGVGVVADYHGPSGVSASGSLQLYNDTGTRRAREAVKWNAPFDFDLVGLIFPGTTPQGSPTFNLKGEVCSSSASLASSDGLVPSNDFRTTRIFVFNTPVRLPANTDRYIGITPDGDDDGDSSNYARMSSHASAPLLDPANLGPILGSYESTAAGDPSWSSSSGRGTRISIFGYMHQLKLPPIRKE